MFTGIITDVGRLSAIEPAGDTHFTIATAYDMSGVDIGASISCSGCCLTVVEKGEDWFRVTASAETLNCTNLSDWRVDQAINLERALKIGDELGGHIVSGHVDGVGIITECHSEGDSIRFTIESPRDLAPFIASKGSVSLDGISLTVNEVNGNRFGVNIIPHTAQMTTLGEAQAGRRINIEIDLLARYVARLRESMSEEDGQ